MGFFVVDQGFFDRWESLFIEKRLARSLNKRVGRPIVPALIIIFRIGRFAVALVIFCVMKVGWRGQMETHFVVWVNKVDFRV